MQCKKSYFNILRQKDCKLLLTFLNGRLSVQLRFINSEQHDPKHKNSQLWLINAEIL